MGLIRGGDPFDEMQRFWDGVNRLFEQRAAGVTAGAPWSPAVDIVETADAVVLYVELAGLSSRDIDIQLVDDTLTLRGERPAVAGPDRRLLRAERPTGAFQRSFTLGMPVEQGQVTAAYRNGLLEITLPKRAQMAPKRVKVDVSEG